MQVSVAMGLKLLWKDTYLSPNLSGAPNDLVAKVSTNLQQHSNEEQAKLTRWKRHQESVNKLTETPEVFMISH